MTPREFLEQLETMLDSDALTHREGFGKIRLSLNLAVIDLLRKIEQNERAAERAA